MIKYYPAPRPATEPAPGMDPLFNALADATRREIVTRLAEGPASVSALAAPLPVSLPAVLQHLKVLETAGIVVSRKEGRTRTCRLDPAALSRAEGWIAERRQFLSRQLDRLEAHLAETKDQP